MGRGNGLVRLAGPQEARVSNTALLVRRARIDDDLVAAGVAALGLLLWLRTARACQDITSSSLVTGVFGSTDHTRA